MEEALVCRSLRFVTGVHRVNIPVKGVRIEHQKLACPDHATARTWLIPELGLHLVEHHREVTPRAQLLPRKICDDFLVRKAKRKVSLAAVLQLIDDIEAPSASLFHQFLWNQCWHPHFRAIDKLLLLAENLLHLADDLPGKREVGVDASAQLAEIARSQQ